MLAVPLARTSPREGRYGKLFLAIVVYFVYSNTISILEHLVDRGTVPGFVGVWPVHVVMVLLVLALLVNQTTGGPASRREVALGATAARQGRIVMRILDAYIARHVVVGTLLALAVLLSLTAVATFVDELDSVGRGRYGVAGAIEFVILTLPRHAFVQFPLAAVIGALIGSGPWPSPRSSPWSAPPGCRPAASPARR